MPKPIPATQRVAPTTVQLINSLFDALHAEFGDDYTITVNARGGTVACRTPDLNVIPLTGAEPEEDSPPTPTQGSIDGNPFS